MYCPKCGLENSEDAKVCISCGQLLPMEEIPLQPQIPAKTSTLAIWSFVLAIMGLFTFMITALPAFICGIIGLVKIGRSNGQLKGTGLAIAGIAIPSVSGLLFIPITLAILMPALAQTRHLAQSIMCGTNLSGLGKAMIVYVEDHNDMYPSADNWCDLLVKDCNVTWEQLRCPADDKEENKSSYAFNINLVGRKASKVPPDTVLLFETNPAVNPVGGPQLLNTEKHQGDGCNILFANSHVKFIKSEELSTLRWNPE
ncbi:MAG: DUF4190 domain-containing protein [Sedimentisphaerales bacterium]